MRALLIASICLIAHFSVGVSSQRTCDELNKGKDGKKGLKQCYCSMDGDVKTIACHKMPFLDFYHDMISIEKGDKITSLILNNVTLRSNTTQTVDPINTWVQDLKTLKLSNMALTLDDIYSWTHSIKYLETLSIKDTLEISRLNSTIFDRKFSTLKTFQFSSGNLMDIEKNLLGQSCPNLERLDLGDNQFDSIPTDAITPLKNLTYLSFYNNKITDIDSETVKKLQSNLKNLNTFVLNTLECSCETYKSTLRDWLKNAKIKNVQCGSPDKLKDAEITETGKDKFCKGNGAGSITLSSFAIISPILVSIMYFQK